MPMHAGQLHIDAVVVQRLLRVQFPQWKDLPVEEVRTTGTVNALFSIGKGLVARFPLVGQDPDDARAWLSGEAAAAREFAKVSTVPTSEPVAIGEPGAGYPLPWSIQTWLPGRDATVDDPGESVQFARDLAELILALRRVDTRGRRFAGAGRGGHLGDQDDWVAECLQRSTRLLDVTRLRLLWADLKTLPEVDADVMCHGDLTPPNVLVEGGRLVGVLDAGGFGPADPALDLVAAWHLLEQEPREELRRALGCTDLQWERGMAWAFQQAVGLVWYYAESNPSMSRWGRRTLDRIAVAAGR